MNLSKQIGLPFDFDFLTWELNYQKDLFELIHSRIFTINASTLSKYYLNPVAVLINNVYANFWLKGKAGIWADMPFKFKFTVLNKDYVGIETIKTKSIYTGKHSRLIEILSGNVGVLIFPPKLIKSDNLTNNDVFFAILQTGSKFIIPANHVYVIINITPSEPAIILEIHHIQDPSHKLFVKGKGGPFYYVLRNTSHEVVKNPRYRFVNGYVKLSKGIENILKGYGISPKTPILRQLGRKYVKYNQLLQDEKPETIIAKFLEVADNIIDFSHPSF